MRMKIDLQKIPVRELVNGYINSDEEGVKDYGGKLDIRPKYQREFVYKEEQRNAVINTVEGIREKIIPLKIKKYFII